MPAPLTFRPARFAARTAALAIPRRTIIFVAVAAVSLPMYFLFPTAVGLNGDLGRYGSAGLNLICGDGQRVWANYRIEPLFVAILLAFSKVWGAMAGFGPAHCAAPGLNIFWLPVFMSATLILLQMFVVRHLGAGAICFHLVFCLDTALMMLPFNLVRQFVAVVIMMALVSLLIRNRISPAMFSAGLVVTALVHWSAWLLVLVSLVAMALVEMARLRTRTARLSGRSLAVAVAIGAPGVVIGVYLLGAYVLPRFQLAILGPRGLGLSLESSVRGLVSPITLSVLAFAVAIALSLKAGFVRTFVGIAAILYFLVAVSGSVPAMERLRALVLPMSYFIFLYLLHGRSIGPRWQVFNVLFLVFAILNFSWHAFVIKPFDGRPSFTQLIR